MHIGPGRGIMQCWNRMLSTPWQNLFVNRLYCIIFLYHIVHIWCPIIVAFQVKLNIWLEKQSLPNPIKMIEIVIGSWEASYNIHQVFTEEVNISIKDRNSKPVEQTLVMANTDHELYILRPCKHAFIINAKVLLVFRMYLYM